MKTCSSGVWRHTRQQLEGRRVELVNRGIDVYGGPAFLAGQTVCFSIMRHDLVAGDLTLFWKVVRSFESRHGLEVANVCDAPLTITCRGHGLPSRGLPLDEGLARPVAPAIFRVLLVLCDSWRQ